MKRIILITIISIFFNIVFTNASALKQLNCDFNDIVKFEGNIFVAGTGGKLIHSKDDGENWEFIETNFSNNINAIQMDMSNNTLYGVCDEGLFFSFDYLNEKFHSELISNNDLISLLIFKNKFYVLSNRNVLILNDGNWEEISIPKLIFSDIKDLLLFENDLLIVGNNRVDMFNTISNQIKSENISFDNEIVDIAIDNSNLLIATKHKLYKYDNSYQMTDEYELKAQDIIDVIIESENSGKIFSTGYNYTNEFKLYNYSIGNNQIDTMLVEQLSNDYHFRGFLEEAEIFNLDNSIFIIGANDLILRSKDNGINWTTISNYDVADKSFPQFEINYSNINLVSVSNSSSLYHTENMGATWSKIRFKFDDTFHKFIKTIEFNNRNYLISRMANGILITDENFNLIETIKGIISSNIQDFFVLDDEKFLSYEVYNPFNTKTSLVQYTDDKYSTNPQYVLVDSITFTDCSIIENRFCYFTALKIDSIVKENEINSVTYNTNLLMKYDIETNDTTYKIIPQLEPPLKVLFLDENTGFICGAFENDNDNKIANIYKTEDGGDSWELIFEDDEVTIQAMKLIKSKLFIFGSNGLIANMDYDGSELNYILKGSEFHFWNVSTDGKHVILSHNDSKLYKLNLEEITSVIEDIEIVYAPTIFTEVPYPNPAVSFINLDIVWDIKYKYEQMEFEVYETNGNKLELYMIPSTNYLDRNSASLQFNVSQLGTGIYYLVLKLADYRKAVPIVVVR